MNKAVVVKAIEQKIFVIRGHRVMLDRDLAELYGVETRVLNQAVRRNIERFPSDFMFSLTRGEILRLSQFVITSDIKYSPNVCAFTEQGVAMLSSVLNSRRAIQVNIRIMRVFTKMKELASAHRGLVHRLELLERKYADHDEKLVEVFEAIRQLIESPEPVRPKVGFKAGRHN